MPIAFNKYFPNEFKALIDFLTNNQWEEANRIIESLECSRNLLILDELWTKFSNGHFGFSIQSKIWQEVGGFINPDPFGNAIFQIHGFETGDLDDFMEAHRRYLDRIYYCRKMDFSLNAPLGYLPFGKGGDYQSLINRFSYIIAAKNQLLGESPKIKRI